MSEYDSQSGTGRKRAVGQRRIPQVVVFLLLRERCQARRSNRGTGGPDGTASRWRYQSWPRRYSSSKVMPALATSRTMSRSPMAGAGV